MFVDLNRQDVWDKIRHRDFRAFAPWLTRETIEQAATRAGVALGGGPLCLFVLVWLAVACALHPTRSFAAVPGLALKLMRNDPRWDPHALQAAARTRGQAAPRTRRGGARTRATPRSKH